jgi:hypothetical protein
LHSGKEEKGGARTDCISSKGQNIISIACIDQGLHYSLDTQ